MVIRNIVSTFRDKDIENGIFHLFSNDISIIV